MTADVNTLWIERNGEPYEQGTFDDECLSWAARGLLASMGELPAGSQVELMELAARDPHGAAGVRRILAELRLRGYLVRRRIASEDGSFEFEATLKLRAPQAADGANIRLAREGPGIPASVSEFEESFGPLTPARRARLVLLEERYSPEWVSDAILEAAIHHPADDLKYPLIYIGRILQRWRTEGRGLHGRSARREDPESRQRRIASKIERFIGAQS